MTSPGRGDQRVLVLRAQDGDVDAFEALVGPHQGRLFRIAYMVLHDRMDAEDVVQEALLLAWRRLHLLEEPNAFGSWVSQITTRAATDVVRRQARRATDSAETEDLDTAASDRPFAGSSAGTGQGPERSALVNAQMEALALVLQSLETTLRTCWVLREIDGMSYSEISTVIGATEPTVRGRIARARAHIIDRMKEWR
ncbi:sigma-70 family RNA polymerase sigma factor [Citricoccus sp.]|uniref:RNA polymerase sigma factor n=1 Tax=Citricoccus sp. TaxID=1978372 RepID=UPI0028BEA0CC|nr:sigma-70 family RNA polymerase sigma factor [Citricoccus sp.]